MATVESGGDRKAFAEAEGSIGKYQMGLAALADVNAWAVTNIRPADLHTEGPDHFAANYYLAVILYSNRCRGNIFQAVASWNIGFQEVRRGWYPRDYLEDVFGNRLSGYLRGKAVIEERKNRHGRRLFRLMTISNNRYPEIGEPCNYF